MLIAFCKNNNKDLDQEPLKSDADLILAKNVHPTESESTTNLEELTKDQHHSAMKILKPMIRQINI